MFEAQDYEDWNTVLNNYYQRICEDAMKIRCCEEEDWETTGSEEMEKLFRNARKAHNTIDLRDMVACIDSLIEVCTATLTNETYCPVQSVATILTDCVTPKIRELYKRIGELCDSR